MAAYCTNCAAALEPGVKFCASCGAPTEAPLPPAPNPTAAVSGGVSVSAGAHSVPTPSVVGRRYPALRIVAIVLKVAAIIWLIVGVIGLITGISVGSNPSIGFPASGGMYGFFFLLTSLYFAVMSWAGAELLHVFMDIEENTRQVAAR